MESSPTKEVFAYEEIVRTMIQRENELINHRISWLMAAQGLLFSALAFAWDKQQAKPLVWLLCFLGASIAVVTFLALNGATLAMKRLFEWWEKNAPANYDGPGVMGLPLPSPKLVRYLGPWIFFPVLFFIAWAVVYAVKG